MRITLRLCTFLTTCFALAVSSQAFAADSTGQFAVRGGGRITCEQFVKAKDEKNQNMLAMVAGWIDGYLTGSNQHLPENYAVAPWASTQLLGVLLYHNCKKHPTANFFVAANSMVKQLKDYRMTEASPIVEAEYEGKKMRLYKEVLRRMQVSLSERGFYDGTASGEFSEPLAAAIKNYQRSVNQPETGLPDQRVLWELLRPGEAKQ